MEREKAKARQGTRTELSGKLPESGDTRDIVAAKVGMSGRQILEP
jgi:hypothetical protein